MTKRPLDVLGDGIDKKIIIKTKFGEEISGILKAFDAHINVWMEEAKITGDKELALGKVLVRGDNIIYISPGK